MARPGIFISLVLSLVTGPVFGQQGDSTRSGVLEDLEEALELFDSEDSEIESEQLTQFLQDLAADPVNVNRADINSLMQIPGVNFKIARSVIEYRSNIKPFESVSELVRVPNIGRVTFDKMRPYITVGSGMELGKTLYTNYRYWTAGGGMEIFSRYQRDLQKARGYRELPEDGGFTGNSVKYYQRFRYRSNHLSMNLTQEKDAGEPLPGPANFDYSSGHFALKDNGNLHSLVIGDYSLSFGEGLVLWNGGAFGKGSNVTGAANRNSRGIKPYTSAQETDFYRGAAASYGGKLRLTGFWSDRKRTASVIDDDTTRFPGSNGNHRTLRERSQKNNLRQKLYGGRLQIELPFGLIGATGYYTQFNKYIAANTGSYAQFDFRGYSHNVAGIDYSLVAGPVLIFGEAGRSKNAGAGLISGLESTVGENTGFTVVYRNYGRYFQSILGNGFGESSGEPQNEEGIYFGLEHTLNKKIVLSAYFDQFRFPGPRFGTNQPTQGYDWLGKIDVQLDNDLKLYLQVRSEIKEDEFETADIYGRLQRKLGNARRSSVRGNLEYRVNPEIRLRTRGELVRSKQAGAEVESGYLLYQDLRLFLKDKLTLDARVTMFDTESFATRVYQFENDLLYVFASQSLFNKGQRMYLLLNYEPFDFIELWSKFGITIYEDQLVIGSGLNEIEGRKRSEVGIQIRMKF